MVRRRLILSAALLASAAFSGTAFAEWKPDRPVNIVVPWAAGGSTDQVIRVVAGELQKALGQTVVRRQPAGRLGLKRSAPRACWTGRMTATRWLPVQPRIWAPMR